jgi:LysR family hydrogen peroxide-inducible transcriptional activator
MRFSPHPITLRQLQYAVAVAELRSFHRAAERCHVSQPSLSAQLAALEEALGVKLFERSSRRVLPTPPGEELLARARKVLVEADDLVEAASRLGDPLSGTLRVGVIPTISPYLLPEIAAPLRRAFPRTTFVWVEDETATLVASLAEGRIDAAIVALEADLGDVEHEVVAKDPFVLAAPAGHELTAGKKPLKPSDLAGADVLLLDDGHCFREQALSFCSRAKTTELDVRATSLATLAQMVAGGAGVTLLPALALPIENRNEQLEIKRFTDPAPGRTIAFVWRRGSPLGRAVREVAAAVRKAYPANRRTSSR